MTKDLTQYWPLKTLDLYCTCDHLWWTTICFPSSLRIFKILSNWQKYFVLSQHNIVYWLNYKGCVIAIMLISHDTILCTDFILECFNTGTLQWFLRQTKETCMKCFLPPAPLLSDSLELFWKVLVNTCITYYIIIIHCDNVL